MITCGAIAWQCCGAICSRTWMHWRKNPLRISTAVDFYRLVEVHITRCISQYKYREADNSNHNKTLTVLVIRYLFVRLPNPDAQIQVLIYCLIIFLHSLPDIWAVRLWFWLWLWLFHFRAFFASLSTPISLEMPFLLLLN